MVKAIKSSIRDIVNPPFAMLARFLLPFLGCAAFQQRVPGDSFVYFNYDEVSSSDCYEIRSVPSIYNEGYTYMGSGRTQWNVGGSVDLLFKTNCSLGSLAGDHGTPPSGMRSAVPLGPMGEGSIELRADGRLGDWGTVFNNGPYTADKGWVGKKEIDDAMFGVCAGSTARAVRTHAPRQYPGIPTLDRIGYSGSFPASRLRLLDKALPLEANVTAWGQFSPGNERNSTAPVVYFSFAFSNPGDPGDSAVNASVLFHLPNVISGTYSQASPSDKLQHLTLTSPDDGNVTAGNLTIALVAADGFDYSVEYLRADNLSGVFAQFENTCKTSPAEQSPGSTGDSNGGSAGFVVHAPAVPAGRTVHVTLALTWYFPNRLWGSTNLGHFYEQFYHSSVDVARAEANTERLASSESTGASYQSAIANASPKAIPAFLKDLLINSAGIWGRTSLYTRDGRWRNFESHSCAQMEPPHIHLPRSVGYILHFPQLEQQTPKMYLESLSLPKSGGIVQELFGCGCGGCAGGQCDLDAPKGGPRGDDNPALVFDVYMNYKLQPSGGKAFVVDNWNATKAALGFALSAADKFGLTYQLVNTNDEHGIIGDLNTYNSMVYLTALAAGARLAEIAGDGSSKTIYQSAIDRGVAALSTHLWREEGFWKQAWCEHLPQQDNTALQSGALYGLLWAYFLGLEDDIKVPTSNITSHLLAERNRNKAPFGLWFATNKTQDYYGGCKSGALTAESPGSPGFENAKLRYTTGGGGGRSGVGFSDFDTWNAHAFTHAALSIYARAGSTDDALSVAERNANAYRVVMADQWDYRDTTTTYDAKGAIDPDGLPTPSVNSHYGRQTVFWMILFALSGQQLSVPEKIISFEPVPELRSGADWPVLTPFYRGTMRLMGRVDGMLCAEMRHMGTDNGFAEFESRGIRIYVFGAPLVVRADSDSPKAVTVLCEARD